MDRPLTLKELLEIIGKLDDQDKEDTARERFRGFLKSHIEQVGQIRDYIEECLRNTGPQYNRALQDLVNHLGTLIGFKVEFGRYAGVQGEIGYDGLWQSPAGFHIVVEVKTTEVYAIKTPTLLGYIHELVSAKRIPDSSRALGLYVVGRPDPEIRQLENTIIAEKREKELRIISADSLLVLGEMMNQYDVDHEDILAVLLPSGPKVDSVVSLMSSLVAAPESAQVHEEPETEYKPTESGEINYWLTPVKGDEKQSAEEVIETLVVRDRIYAFGERTPGRRQLKTGDWICFYAAGNGVVAHAKVSSEPKKGRHASIRYPDRHPWIFQLDKPESYLNKPVIIDAALRSRLDAFEDADPSRAWGWFVVCNRKVSKNDYEILTGHKG